MTFVFVMAYKNRPLTVVYPEVLDMLYFGHFCSYSSYDGDDIEAPGIVKLVVVDVVVDGEAQVLLLLIVNGLERVAEISAAAGFHLNEYDTFALLCNDVYVTML